MSNEKIAHAAVLEALQDPKTYPPHDPAAAERAMLLGTSCNHDFGDDGKEPNCIKCNMEFQLANRVGKALWRRRTQQAMLRGGFTSDSDQ